MGQINNSTDNYASIYGSNSSSQHHNSKAMFRRLLVTIVTNLAIAGLYQRTTVKHRLPLLLTFCAKPACILVQRQRGGSTAE